MQTLRAKGLGLVGISYDSVEILKTFGDQHGISFPLLSDTGSATIKAYGILNTVVAEALGPNGKDPAVLADLKVYASAIAVTERHRGVPFPGTFVVDREGRVTSRFFEDFYRERTAAASVLLKLGTGGPPVQGTQISTNHLQLKTYPTDSAVALRSRFSLALDIASGRGGHGVPGRLAPSGGFRGARSPRDRT